MNENETFKKISLEIYKSNINKEELPVYESFLSKSLLKEEPSNGEEIIKEEPSRQESPLKTEEDVNKTEEKAKDNTILEIFTNSVESGNNNSNQNKNRRGITNLYSAKSSLLQSLSKERNVEEEKNPFNEKLKKIIYKDIEHVIMDNGMKKKTIHDLIYIEVWKYFLYL